LANKDIEIIKTEKTEQVFDNFYLFNIAPCDLNEFNNTEFAN